MISQTTLDKLEYEKVLTYIANYSSTQQGKEKLLSLKPFNNVKSAELEGLYVTEAKEILIEYDYPPLNYLPNLDEALSQSKIHGTILRQDSIKKILDLSEMSRKVFSFLKSKAEETKLFHNYSRIFFIDKKFEAHISKIFSPSGEINDKASKKLSEIRKEIIKKSSSLTSVIERILKGFSASYLVQEEYVTQRDGRFVIPIKAEHKRHVRGFIHSESNSGQTVYIEPEETLELNNEILSLGFAEKREIEKILKQLTELIGANSTQLKLALSAVTSIDIIFAKAKYSLEIMGAFPLFNNHKKIRVINARHPILMKKIGLDLSIPLNYEYNDNDVTLITGPNAGGKTVVLKTLGLLSALAQTGIHIPVDPDSEFYFFNNIMLDIGDEQSLEDDLSTFSSHLENIKNILAKSDDKSLILIDEIGTGTDPSEGTALAAAFLISMKENNALVVATTHHGNLKIIASELDNFQNASMEYDLEKLAPTYKFRQGTPGSSYAFEVAQKIGLDQTILSLAKEYLDSDKNKVENFIVDLENKSLELKKKLDQLGIENTRLKGLTGLYERENKKLKEKKDKILKETKDKADSFLSDINSQFEQTIKKIKESNADKCIIKEEKAKLQNIKKIVKESYSEPIQKEPNKGDYALGDFVQIKDSFTTGEIVELDKERGTVTIDTGSLRIKAKTKNLIHAIKPKEVNNSAVFVSTTSVESTILDIRGQKPEEIEFDLIRFIDEAHLAGLKQVEIIHGKGTGVLRETVHHLLKNHQLVKSYDLASIKLGGAGATDVKLK